MAVAQGGYITYNYYRQEKERLSGQLGCYHCGLPHELQSGTCGKYNHPDAARGSVPFARTEIGKAYRRLGYKGLRDGWKLNRHTGRMQPIHQHHSTNQGDGFRRDRNARQNGRDNSRSRSRDRTGIANTFQKRPGFGGSRHARPDQGSERSRSPGREDRITTRSPSSESYRSGSGRDKN